MILDLVVEEFETSIRCTEEFETTFKDLRPMSINRRQILAGAAATAAVAAMPVVAIGAVEAAPSGFVSKIAEERALGLTIAWSQAMKQAWEQSMGPVDEMFAELYPEEYRILQDYDCSKASPGMVALFEDGARERMPRNDESLIPVYVSSTQESA